MGEIEAEANGGQGAAKEYVRAMREVAEKARVDLMGALAANHLARQEPRKVISLLENALEHRQTARTWHGSSGRLLGDRPARESCRASAGPRFRRLNGSH
jgi:hypothetical protein